MGKTKRMIAILLASVLAVTSVPGTVQAETEPEVGIKPEDGTTIEQPFLGGTGGSTNFRIPCIVTLNDGTLVAACDARWDHAADACGLDTIVSYSKDNGLNWNYTFANYLGDNGNKKHLQSTAFIDPALATDGETIYMIADLWPGGYAINTAPLRPVAGENGLDENGNLRLSGDNRSSYAYHLEKNDEENADEDSYYVIKENETDVVVDGYTVDAYFNIKADGAEGYSGNLFYSDSPYLVYPTDFLYLTTSTDGGATWSIPSLLNLKKEAEQTLLVGPGRGIVTSTGRIVFTAYEWTGGDRNSACFYSDDDGVTWERGASVTSQSSEATVVEADGRLYMFTRHGGYYVSEDWGATWSDKKEVGVTYINSCQLSAVTYSKKINGKTAIILSAPSNTGTRAAGKLFVGLVQEDGTISWDYTYSVNGSAYYAYSCLTELNDGSMGLLYESGSAAITYTNRQILDIAPDAFVGNIWCEDEDGNIITGIDMKSNESVSLTLYAADKDAEFTVETTEDHLLDISVEENILTVSSKAVEENTLSRGTVTFSDGTNSLELKVNVTDVQDYGQVDLRMGEAYTITNYNGEEYSVENESIVDVVNGEDGLTIKALTEGNTFVLVGSTKYFIIVKNDTKELALDLDESVVIRGSAIQQAADAAIISVEQILDMPPYAKVDELTEDGDYLIGNLTHIVTNEDSKDANPVGRAMRYAGFATQDLTNYMWTITAVEDGYTVQDKEGRYLSFNGTTVKVSDDAQALAIAKRSDGSYSIAYENIYLNDYANAGVRAAGYASDNNSWYFYQSDDSYKITGLKEGRTSLIIGGTTYNIIVGDPIPVEAEEAYEELETKIDTFNSYLNLGSNYDTASYEAFLEAFHAVQDLIADKTERDAEKIKAAQSRLEQAVRDLVPKDENNNNNEGSNGGNNTSGSNEDNKQQNTSGSNEENASKLPDVGSTYSDDANAVYQFTSSTASGGTVTYVKPKKKTNKKITIPAVIKVNNLTYKVTEIADSACKGNKKLTQVTIGSNVAKIGKSAFASCKKLKKITIQSSVLKSVGKKAINGIHKKCVIKAPKKKLAAYKNLFTGKGLKSTMKITK